MKSRPLLNALLAIVVLAFTEIASAQDSAPRSSDSILGTWNAPSVINAGKESHWDHEVLIEKDRFVFKRKGKETESQIWEITIDDSKSPKRITMTGSSGLPKKIHAIYSKSPKDLRIAFLPGMNGSSLEEFPTDMTSTAKNAAIVFVLTPKQENTR